MKEITRIHLAKIAYDIELDAKKDIQKYIAALERYADDPEILDDIEIRITELLTEQGVASGGVITREDVAAVRARLGEPSDFAADGSGDVALGAESLASEGRRVYRDTDSALMGGVLAGFGRFFGIDPLWVRLIFIVLLLASFGAAAVVYVILWLIIPPARTAAEKLQMRGQPVTLASIKGFVAAEDQVNPSTVTMRRVLRGIAGILLVAGGIAAMAVTVIVVASVTFGAQYLPTFIPMGLGDAWWVSVAFILMALAGVLLAILCFILADAVFRRRWSRRIGVTVVAIISVGIISFGTAMVMGYSGVQYELNQIEKSMVDTKVDLPVEFANAKKLVVTAHAIRSASGASSELMVQYVVDPGKPRYELTALPGMKPEITVNGDEARVAFKSTTAHNRAFGWVQPQLIIRGPALDEVTVKQGNLSYSAMYPNGQEQLRVSTGSITRATVMGRYGHIITQGAGEVDASQASIADLAITMDGGSVVAGVVRHLEVTQPDTCPANTMHGYDGISVRIQAVSSGEIIYNGSKQKAQTIRHGCGAVIVGEENYSRHEYDTQQEGNEE